MKRHTDPATGKSMWVVQNHTDEKTVKHTCTPTEPTIMKEKMKKKRRLWRLISGKQYSILTKKLVKIDVDS